MSNTTYYKSGIGFGCVLDRLQWDWVKSKIEEKFADMDI